MSAYEELRDALDDAILRAYCEPLYPLRHGEDPETVNAIARAAVIGSPVVMRRVARIQAAAWAAVEERVEDAGETPSTCSHSRLCSKKLVGKPGYLCVLPLDHEGPCKDFWETRRV